MFKKYPSYFTALLLTGVMAACNSATPDAEAPAAKVQTPVTVAHVSLDTMMDYVEVNAASSFQLKNFVKANANGYLRSSNIHLGQQIQNGQVLFTVTTKEAQSLGNTLNKLDSSFKFSGTNSIRAGANGFITQLDHQTGDYVQDGEQLAVISDRSSFVFIMNVPYELHAFVAAQKSVMLVLPDGTVFQGTIASSLPQVDSVSQTERITIKLPPSAPAIPEYLVAKARILKSNKVNTIAVPKAAILTDETQTVFWIMKMTDDHTAVKVIIKKGMETSDKVEILSPVLNPQDRILISGNYGLEDTALVNIIKSSE
jgi:multidrug efflux pump subunit AcrA (membrane-fusion protein)